MVLRSGKQLFNITGAPMVIFETVAQTESTIVFGRRSACSADATRSNQVDKQELKVILKS